MLHTHTYTQKLSRESRVDWWWWVDPYGCSTFLLALYSKLIFIYYFLVERVKPHLFGQWYVRCKTICAIHNDRCAIDRPTSQPKPDSAREWERKNYFYKRILAISLEVIQCLQIDQYRNCHPLSDYYCINARCMAWIYFGPCVSVREDCRICALSLLTLPREGERARKNNIYCKHKLGHWPMIWSKFACIYLDQKRCAARPKHIVIRLFLRSSACSGQNVKL